MTALNMLPFDPTAHWDHEFTGKAALAEIAENPPRTVVTLEWDADDIADVYRSQFRGLDEEPCMPLDLTGPSDVMPDSGVPDPVTGLPKTKDYHARPGADSRRPGDRLLGWAGRQHDLPAHDLAWLH